MHGPAIADHWHAAGTAADGLTVALEDYQRAQDELAPGEPPATSARPSVCIPHKGEERG